MKEILKKAYARVQDPVNWCATSVAEDSQGQAVFPNDPQAIRWSICGAILKELSFITNENINRKCYKSILLKLNTVAAKHFCRDPQTWSEHIPASIHYVNNYLGHSASLQVLAETIRSYPFQSKFRQRSSRKP